MTGKIGRYKFDPKSQDVAKLEEHMDELAEGIDELTEGMDDFKLQLSQSLICLRRETRRDITFLSGLVGITGIALLVLIGVTVFVDSEATSVWIECVYPFGLCVMAGSFVAIWIKRRSVSQKGEACSLVPVREVTTVGWKLTSRQTKTGTNRRVLQQKSQDLKADIDALREEMRQGHEATQKLLVSYQQEHHLTIPINQSYGATTIPDDDAIDCSFVPCVSPSEPKHSPRTGQLQVE